MNEPFLIDGLCHVFQNLDATSVIAYQGIVQVEILDNVQQTFRRTDFFQKSVQGNFFCFIFGVGIMFPFNEMSLMSSKIAYTTVFTVGEENQGIIPKQLRDAVFVVGYTFVVIGSQILSEVLELKQK